MMEIINKTVDFVKRFDGAKLVLISLLPFFEPKMFKTPEFSSGDTLFDILKIISVTIIIATYIIWCKPSLLLGITMAMQVVIFIATVANNGSVSRYFGPAVTMVAMVAAGQIVIERRETKHLLGYLRNTLSVLVGLNLISICLIKAGVLNWDCSFLGIDNRWIYFLLPWVCISFIYAALEKGVVGWSEWTIYAIALAHVLLVWAVGAIIVLMFWPVLWIISRITPYRKRTISSHITVIMVIASGMVNFALVSGRLLDLLTPIISGVFHKDVTLSGRTHLWKAVVEVLNSAPLTGMGVQDEEFDKRFFFEQSGGAPGTAVNHPHNYLLNVGYHGGLIALALFSLIVLYAAYGIDKIKHIILFQALFCSLGCILIASLVDTLDFSLFHLLIPLMVWADRITSGEMELRKNE